MNCEHCKLPREAWHDCMQSLMAEVERLRPQLEAAHKAQRHAEMETGRALAAHAIESAQLRGTLSLTEEGLANYAQENQKLRECWAEALANYAKQNTEVETLKRLAAQLHAIRNESLTCAMACPHSCNACERLYSLIRRALPQPGEHGG